MAARSILLTSHYNKAIFISLNKAETSNGEQFWSSPSNIYIYIFIYVVLAGQTSETCAAKLQKYFFPVKPLFLFLQSREGEKKSLQGL